MAHDVSRPITLYVDKVNTNPDLLPLFERRRISVVDIEIKPQDAVDIIEYLRERNNQGNTGTIRIRLTGRLILS